MLEIKLPLLNWKGKELESIYHLFQATPELGFLYKTSIRDHIRENENRGTLWAAYLNKELVGVAAIGSRRLYPHLARHGEIGVIKEFRRRRVGTALYLAQILQMILEGRREAEDTIIPALSPWMAGPTGCSDGGIGFLPSLNYIHYGTLPSRTSAFKDIQLWGKKTLEVHHILSRSPEGVRVSLIDTQKTRDTFAKNLENYKKHNKPLHDAIIEQRQWVLDNFDVQAEGPHNQTKGRLLL